MLPRSFRGRLRRQLHDAVDVHDSRGQTKDETQERQPRARAEPLIEKVSARKANHNRQHKGESDRAQLANQLQIFARNHAAIVSESRQVYFDQ